MTRRITFISFIFLFTITLGQTVNKKEIEQIANNWVIENNKKEYSIDNIEEVIENKQKVLYLVNYKPKGFLLLSADKQIKPIIAYSFSNTFSKNENHPVYGYLKGMKKSISVSLKKRSIQNAKQNLQQWKELENIPKNKEKGISLYDTSKKEVKPLVKVEWGQGYPYNKYCPEYEEGKNSVVGCVAVAMGQIMSKWKYPNKGIGFHSYEHYHYGELSADFGKTNYNWNNITSDNISLLLYHCGVSVDMDYNIEEGSGSGALSVKAAAALIKYFGYDRNSLIYIDREANEEKWKELINKELNEGRPVYYAGDSEKSGHAFVCDGYDKKGKYHINWGWKGSSNGYYEFDDLKYKYNQEAIIGIKPASSNTLTLKAPSNNATNVSIPVSFEWADVKGADNYRICVATSPDDFNKDGYPDMFPNSVLNKTTGTKNYYNWNEAEPNKTYYWAVRVNIPGTGTQTTDIHSFTTSSGGSSGDDFYITNQEAITSTTVEAGGTIKVSCSQCYSGSTLDSDMESVDVGYYLV